MKRTKKCIVPKNLNSTKDGYGDCSVGCRYTVQLKNFQSWKKQSITAMEHCYETDETQISV